MPVPTALDSGEEGEQMTITKTFVSILACAMFAWAQTDRGGIRGTVTDQSGAVIPGAAIRVTSSESGITTSVTSTGSGTYNVGALPSGIYQVEVAQAGFKMATQ